MGDTQAHKHTPKVIISLANPFGAKSLAPKGFARLIMTFGVCLCVCVSPINTGRIPMKLRMTISVPYIMPSVCDKNYNIGQRSRSMSPKT